MTTTDQSGRAVWAPSDFSRLLGGRSQAVIGIFDVHTLAKAREQKAINRPWYPLA